MCTRGKDINAQLQFENSIFPRFGRSNRSSEKFSAIAKSNFQKSKTTMAGKESEFTAIPAQSQTPAILTTAASAIVEHDKVKNSHCIKNPPGDVAAPITVSNNFDGKYNHNGINETTNDASQMIVTVQRTSEVLHTDL
jgi:hypothetical protein